MLLNMIQFPTTTIINSQLSTTPFKKINQIKDGGIGRQEGNLLPKTNKRRKYSK